MIKVPATRAGLDSLEQLAAMAGKGLRLQENVHPHGRPNAGGQYIGEIDREIDMAKLERVLMEEGIRKFIDPQKALIALIAEKRAASE